MTRAARASVTTFVEMRIFRRGRLWHQGPTSGSLRSNEKSRARRGGTRRFRTARRRGPGRNPCP